MTPSLSLAEWLDTEHVSATQQRIVLTLASHHGAWISAFHLANAVYPTTHDQHIQDANLAALRTHIWRLRAKLLSSPWRVESAHRSGQRARYRLVP